MRVAGDQIVEDIYQKEKNASYNSRPVFEGCLLKDKDVENPDMEAFDSTNDWKILHDHDTDRGGLHCYRQSI
jgi:hypothetical protein